MDEGWAMSTRDPYTPNPAVDVHELIRYGKEKNVGIVLWLTWLTVENNFDLFKTFNEWGVKGLKIDFMDRSDQWMVNYYERVAKEAAEHATIVDLIRNDLSMVSEHVTVASYRYIDRLQTNKGPILQTSSEICGMLPGDYTKRLGDILFSLLPAGSITGAPKPRTMQIIAEAEGYERGFYTGVMGCYADGRLDSAVMIRFIEQEDGQLYFKAGGGITAQSRWESEYNEVIQKIYVPIY